MPRRLRIVGLLLALLLPAAPVDAAPAVLLAGGVLQLRLSVASITTNPAGLLVVESGGARWTLPAGLSRIVSVGPLEVGDLAAPGALAIAAPRLSVTGQLDAPKLRLEAGDLLDLAPGSVLSGQSIALRSRVLLQTGTIDAVRPEGGSVTIDAENVVQQGAIRASGLLGVGGTIAIEAKGIYQDVQPSILDVGAGLGGEIRLEGKVIQASGRWNASGADGGRIAVRGEEIRLVGARLLADGERRGGTIRLGDRAQGDGGPRLLMIGAASFVSAERGGRIDLWAGGTAEVHGEVLARPGGSIELSAGERLAYTDGADAGEGGTVLLDPKNLTAADSGGTLPFATILAGNVLSDFLSMNLVALQGGNLAVGLPRSDLVATDAGAVYLIDGQTGATIAILTGSAPNDRVGERVAALTNGTYVVTSPFWDRGATVDAGAATWGNGTTGVVGAVSAANSLVGSQNQDRVGSGGVAALANGNFVVTSPLWNNAAIAMVGAATWGNGATGITGPVSAANSLVGSQNGDKVGENGITTLTNGNYVVQSPSWARGPMGAVGAATWGNGATGITGAVSTANSLVGFTANDLVSQQGVTALTNGNYVVASQSWHVGGAAVGAATWGNGATGITGSVSAANSLVGSLDQDRVGSGGVVALANGNYVVRSQSWNKAATAIVGAATWGNGATGITGPVSVANSLVGSAIGDAVSSAGVVPLTNGNYVVLSSGWNAPGAIDAGAATWGNGATGITGAVSAANSLVGSTANDFVANVGATALANGNYVVESSLWDRDGVANVGAATWGNGATGITGPVSVANSLVGSQADDRVAGNLVVALSNGNAVVQSADWDNGGLTNSGAVTWLNGTTGITGQVTVTNSLVGIAVNQRVGLNEVTALANGNYLVTNVRWNGGFGAALVGNGTTGTTGVITFATSIHGSNPNDFIGQTLPKLALASGDVVFLSSAWDNGPIVNAGAVTWASGTTGQSFTGFGPITATNSVLGLETFENPTTVVEIPGAGSVFAGFIGGRGRLVQLLSNPYTVEYRRFNGASNTLPVTGIAHGLSEGTNVTLQASNDLTSASVISATSAAGLRLAAGRSVVVSAPIDVSDGTVHLVANDRLSGGVVDTQRDPGAAQLSTAGAALTANTVIAELRDGAGKTNSTSGQLTLGAVTAGMLVATSTTSIQLTGPLAVTSFALAAPSGVQLGSGAVLGGSGTVNGALTVGSGGTLSPGASPGTLTVAGSLGLVPGATLRIEIVGSQTGQFDQVVLSGPVVLGNATLSVTVTPSATAGPHLTIVRNDGAAPVVGTFAGLPEGSLLSVGGVSVRVRYADGDGNDVTLGVVTAPAATTGPASATSATATFSATVSPGDSSTSVVFEYGTVSGVYTHLTAPVSISGFSAQSVSATAVGLLSGTTYFYRVRATNEFGTVFGSEAQVTTGSPSPPGAGGQFMPFTAVGTPSG
ncbi:MAG: hypothetical protein U0556_15430 [Dehalococcoidia bacterium]